MEANMLEGMNGYLSGGIEFKKDDGVGWRIVFKDLTVNAEIPVGFYDPTDKGDDVCGEIAEEREKIRHLKRTGQFEEVTNIMKDVRRWDLRAVDKADFLVVMIDTDVFTCGTWDEVFLAERQQKPILAIVKGGAKCAPDWLFPVVNYKEIFSNIEECVSYLGKINSGEIELDSRWVHLQTSN